MIRKSLTRLVLIAALLIASGASAASAVDFGTTDTGVPTTQILTFQWGNALPMSVSHFTAPAGYTVIDHSPKGLIQFGQTYQVLVRLFSNTPGTYSGTLWVWNSLGSGQTAYLTGKVVTPCNTTPTVGITGPGSGSTPSPNGSGNVILSATASDSAGIDRVEFFVDGAKVETDFSSAYAYAWPARSGSHQVYARAYNSCGNSATSGSTTFTVNCGNPSVALTSPANGSTVSPNGAGNVILQASASHSTGISKVNFFVDGNLVRTDTSAPYAYAWSASSGSHVAVARAFSHCGGAGVSSGAATFTVN